MEAEYCALASTAAEITWLSFILRDNGLYLRQPSTLFCDNVSALHMTVNPVFHARSKHIEIDYHFVLEKVALGSLVTCSVTSANQVANLYTKPLPCQAFERLQVKLSLRPKPRPNLRGRVEGVIQNDQGFGQNIAKSQGNSNHELLRVQIISIPTNHAKMEKFEDMIKSPLQRIMLKWRNPRIWSNLHYSQSF